MPNLSGGPSLGRRACPHASGIQRRYDGLPWLKLLLTVPGGRQSLPLVPLRALFDSVKFPSSEMLSTGSRDAQLRRVAEC